MRLARGFITPDFSDYKDIFSALVQTIAFAVLGVALGALFGFLLSLVFEYRLVHISCAVLRSIHELFWALIFLQFFGLHPLTGVLAIAIPFSAVCAKVYAEILEEADTAPYNALPNNTRRIASFFYTRLPLVWAHFKTYTSYRLECGLRTSAVLGFIGLPTLGFYLETFFKQGLYSQATALLITFYLLIASMRWWLRPKLLPVLLIAAVYILLPDAVAIDMANVKRFFSEDIVPYPLRMAEESGATFLVTMQAMYHWLYELFWQQAFDGIVQTLLLTQISLVLSGMLALLLFPLITSHFQGAIGRKVGHGFLVVLRSTPEYLLAYIFLQLWGPSMLPAVVALMLHNGAIIGHLCGRYASQIPLSKNYPVKGFNLFSWEIVPRIYPQFLAFLFYRWEIIFRETAILGMLGIYTLGFYVDSAFAEIRYDRAVLLIAITAIINIGIDSLSRRIRRYLRLKTTVQCG
ncbi:ABC transporter, permease protein [hydrothermal vent metagenome]|uniref:ABC transporter, permease protein n=1 Tax=hydrothermal vent metagenome TaxID=652676 RepID=A0A3B0X2J4_9ZZZZ